MTENDVPELPDIGSSDIWMLGLRFALRPQLSGAELYTIVFEAKDDGPVVHDGRVVFFVNPRAAHRCLALEDDLRLRSLAAPTEVYRELDFSEAALAITTGTD